MYIHGHCPFLLLQIESTARTIEPNQCLTGKVTIDNSVGNETFFLVTWSVVDPSIQLTDPSGKIYEKAQFGTDAASKSARLAVPGTAQVEQLYFLLLILLFFISIIICGGVFFLQCITFAPLNPICFICILKVYFSGKGLGVLDQSNCS